MGGILDRVGEMVLYEEEAFGQRTEEEEYQRTFRAEEMASPKVLGWKQAGQVESQLAEGMS